MYQPQMNKTKPSNQTHAPFCKVCFDAKKPESVYTSHFVKSAPGPDGQIICPTLLNQACRNCGQLGHTSSYCVKTKQSHPQPQFKTASAVAVAGGAVGAEAELRLIASTFKSKNQEFQAFQAFQEFPSLLSNASNASNAQKEESEEPRHVYNPKSNPFGALSLSLSQKQTTKINSSFQKQSQQPQSQQPQSQQPAAKPMTMAERLKTPPALPAPALPAPAPAPSHAKVKFVDLPPKSQFWWQDED
jgi:hypothetical protein